jgi:hypothetical protein
VVFDEFKDKIKTYPPKLQGLLRVTIAQVEKQGRTLRHTFLLLQFLALLPAAGAILVTLIKYWDFFVRVVLAAAVIIFTTTNIDPVFLGQ